MRNTSIGEHSPWKFLSEEGLGLSLLKKVADGKEDSLMVQVGLGW